MIQLRMHKKTGIISYNVTCSHHDIAETNYSFGVKQQSLIHSYNTYRITVVVRVESIIIDGVMTSLI